MAGWDDLRQIFIDNGLPELANVIADIAIQEGADNTNTIYEELRKTDTYKNRFKGNTDRLAAGKPVLTENEYLQNERLYEETMRSYGAGGLATRENFSKFIANDVSVNELSKRFSSAYTRVQNAINTNDKPLVDELRKLYPGITDNEIANSLLLGKDGAEYLKSKIDIAEAKAAETEVGIKSTIGAESLANRFSRKDIREGLSKVKSFTPDYVQAAKKFGDESATGIQQELENEVMLGQTSKRTKRLASQGRAQYSGQSGIRTGSLAKKQQV